MLVLEYIAVKAQYELQSVYKGYGVFYARPAWKEKRVVNFFLWRRSNVNPHFSCCFVEPFNKHHFQARTPAHTRASSRLRLSSFVLRDKNPEARKFLYSEFSHRRPRCSEATGERRAADGRQTRFREFSVHRLGALIGRVDGTRV